METIIGTYKQFIILERESLMELEQKGKTMLAEGQNGHDSKMIQKGKIILECIDWIKENNIYNSGNLKVHK